MDTNQKLYVAALVKDIENDTNIEITADTTRKCLKIFLKKLFDFFDGLELYVFIYGKKERENVCFTIQETALIPGLSITSYNAQKLIKLIQTPKPKEKGETHGNL